MISAAAATVVIGGDSLIGKAYRERALHQEQYLPWTSRRSQSGALFLDLENPSPLPWAQWRQKGYKWALIAVAMTGLEACEKRPEASWRLNVEAPLQLASAAMDHHITPILFSTDYVFGGQAAAYTENDRPAPLNVYGRHKAELEAAACKHQNLLMLRLAKVYTSVWGDGSLLSEMAAKLNQGKTLRVASDQRFTPVALDNLLDAVISLQNKGLTGLYQISGSEVWSRLELAQSLASALRLPRAFEVISLDQLNEAFVRPKSTLLSNQKLCQATGWQASPMSQAFTRLAASRLCPG